MKAIVLSLLGIAVALYYFVLHREAKETRAEFFEAIRKRDYDMLLIHAGSVIMLIGVVGAFVFDAKSILLIPVVVWIIGGIAVVVIGAVRRNKRLGR